MFVGCGWWRRGTVSSTHSERPQPREREYLIKVDLCQLYILNDTFHQHFVLDSCSQIESRDQARTNDLAPASYGTVAVGLNLSKKASSAREKRWLYTLSSRSGSQCAMCWCDSGEERLCASRRRPASTGLSSNPPPAGAWVWSFARRTLYQAAYKSSFSCGVSGSGSMVKR
jgi:hypothetical protein